MGNNADNARLVAAAVTKYIGTKETWQLLAATANG